MDHFQAIYAGRAKEYHRMIAVEDVDGNLRQALTRITDWQGKTVLDLGSGTGRFPLIFKEQDCRFICLDLYRNMLKVNQNQRNQTGGNWPLVQGDMRNLPYGNGCTDIAIAGWAIGHLRSWYADEWQIQIDKILVEMQRVVKPGGFMIICETMSTGSLSPHPPARELEEYYQWLERQHSFAAEVIQTDYQFDTVAQAVAYTEFFFGPGLAAKIEENQWARLPEWTGIWFKRHRED